MSSYKHPLYIAFTWHMHQPYYKDMASNKYIMPWVRLHGIKDYYGMPHMLEDFPKAHMTFSITPCLLEQIQDYSKKLEQDPFIELTVKPAGELTAEERVFILKNFFLANWQQMVKTYPRYAQLLKDRGYYFSDEELQIRQKLFSDKDIQDIQMWHNLAWMDTGYQRNDTRISRLIAKGRNFDRSDINTMIDVQKEIISKIIPQYKKLMEEGQVELITSPYYHPIMPLLCDMSVARVASPDIQLPVKGFFHPEDCKAQLNMGMDLHQSVFGRKAKGLWPSEGSVFQGLVPILNETGIEWIATDEDILAKSLNIPLERDLQGCLKNPYILYKPYWIYKGDQKVIGVFRNHVLSDLIGFVYNRWQIERAVEDFYGKLCMIHQSLSSYDRPGLVTIILDGENAWEFYPHNGRDFLARLYEIIIRDQNLKMVTISEYLEQFPPAPQDRIEDLFPGSWINHNFRVWVGHKEDNIAWDYLARAREAIEGYEHTKKKDQDQEKLDLAKKELYIAEGSDWFWWYGDDHYTEQADLFDHIFRKHIINIYQLLDLKAPNEVNIPIIIDRVKSAFMGQPLSYLSPVFDGKTTNYFEWLPAIRFKVKQSGGTAHRSESILKDIYYGFDKDHLYVRLDALQYVKDLNLAFCLYFLSPQSIKIEIRKDHANNSFIGQIIKKNDKDGANTVIENVQKLAGEKILEIGVPFKHLDAEPKKQISFVVCVEKDENEIERWPNHGYFLLTTPYPGYENNLWQP